MSGISSVAPALARRLLEELVYERVRTHVDLMQLSWFETDLDESIERILDDLAPDRPDDGDEPPGRVLASALIDQAWQRVAAEWEARDDDECPLCAADGLDVCKSWAMSPPPPPPRARRRTRKAKPGAKAEKAAKGAGKEVAS